MPLVLAASRSRGVSPTMTQWRGSTGRFRWRLQRSMAIPGRSLRTAESLPKAPGPTCSPTPAAWSLRPGGDLHVAGDDAQVKARQAGELAHQLRDAGQRPHPGGTLRDGVRVALLEILAEGLPILRPPLHVLFGGIEDLLQDHGVGLAVGPDGADVAGKTEGLEDRLVEGDMAVLGTEERAVEVEEDNLGCGGHGNLKIYTLESFMEAATGPAPEMYLQWLAELTNRPVKLPIRLHNWRVRGLNHGGVLHCCWTAVRLGLLAEEVQAFLCANPVDGTIHAPSDGVP